MFGSIGKSIGGGLTSVLSGVGSAAGVGDNHFLKNPKGDVKLGKIDPFNILGTHNKDGGGSINSLTKADVMGAMAEGERKGETLTGSTMEEVGEGRKEVRGTLQDILQGNSAGANRLQQSQNAQDKQMKARQAMAGGGGQMSEGQRQAQDRAQVRDLAEFRSNEQRQALSDLSREWRGAGSDIMKSSGQYGSIMVGARPPAMPAQQQGGLLSGILGGLF